MEARDQVSQVTCRREERSPNDLSRRKRLVIEVRYAAISCEAAWSFASCRKLTGGNEIVLILESVLATILNFSFTCLMSEMNSAMNNRWRD